MARPFLAHRISFAIFLYLVLTNIVAAKTSSSIQNTCERTLYPDLCSSVLRSDPQAGDQKGFAATLIQAASISATNISLKINGKLGSSENQFQLECFRDCYEEFMDAVDRLQESLHALESERYDDINSWVSAAMSDAGSCDDGFTERPGVEEPIKDDVEEFGKLCSVVLSIVKQLQTP